MNVHGIIPRFGYHYDAENHDWEACLFLGRTRRDRFTKEKGFFEYAIKQRDAWKFSRDHQLHVPVHHDDGTTTYIDAVDDRMVDLTAKVTVHLFDEEDMPKGPLRAQFCSSIMSLVEDRMGDLLNMPPKPDEERMVIGEVAVTDNNSGKTFEAEMVL